MPQQIGWSVEAKLLYEIKQLTKSLASRSYIQTFPNFASFPTPGITGTLYVDEATGDIYVWNGTSYVLLSSGITALNGLIAAAQLFATGSTGTDFNISSVGTTHTFNIPTASATNRGLLSSADWTTFNSKIGGTGTTNYVPKFTGAGTLGNSQIFDNGNDLGYNTTTFNSTAGYSSMAIGNTSGSFIELQRANVVGLRLYTDFGESGIIERRSANLLFGTNSTERMRITSAGNVGIGTATPFNNASFTGLTINGNGAGILPIIQLWINGAVRAQFYHDNATLITGTTNATAYNFATNGLERMRITSAGDVGIGTTSPGARLNVTTSTNKYIQVLDAAHATYTNQGTAIAFSRPTDGADAIAGVFVAETDSLANAARGNILFATGGGIKYPNTTERLRITSTGNVGIGNTSPFALLHVGAGGAGSLPDGAGASFNPQLVHSVTSGVAGIEAMVNDGTFNRRIGLFMDQTNAVGGITMTESSTAVPFVIRNAGGERLRIFANGRVGVNTTTDAGYQFDVNGTLRTVNGANFATSSGNVGVGTTTNNGKFDVLSTNLSASGWGNINIYTSDAQAANLGGSISFGGLFSAATTHWASIGGRKENSVSGDYGGYLALATRKNGDGNNTERMRITSIGNVGIGTDSPSEALDVNGRIRARTIDNNASPTFYLTADANGVIQKSTYGPTGGSGTLNYIAKWTPDGVTLGNSQIFDNGTNVGIGTATPITGAANKLDVVTAASANYVRIRTTDALGAAYTFYQNGTTGTGTTDGLLVGYDQGGAYFFNNESTNTYIGSEGNAFLSLRTNATERLRITSAGNVGIGTTSPVVNLHVNKQSTGLAGVQITNSTSGVTLTDGTFVGLDDLNAYLWNYENTNLLFATNNTERMRITSGGNVLIGTTTDTGEKFQVSGDARLTGNVYTNTSSGSNTRLAISATSNVGIGIAFAGTVSDRLHLNDGYVRYGLSSSFPNIYGRIGHTGNSGGLDIISQYDVAGNEASANIRFINGINTATSEKMRITPNGVISVGNSSPRASIRPTLQIGTFATLWEQSSGAVNLAFGAYEGATNTYNYNTTGDAPTMYMQLSGTHRWFNAAAGTANAAFTFTERMRITSAGDVGIGLTSPDSRLHSQIDATALNATNLANGTALAAQFTYPDVAVDATIGIGISLGMNDRGRSYITSTHASTNKDQTSLAFWTTNAGIITEKARITPLGELLILGTANPLAGTNRGNITLNGTGSNILGFTNGTTTTGFLFHTGTDLQLQNSTATGILQFLTNSSERMRISATGNVGINTTNPTGLFTILNGIEFFYVGFGANNDNYYTCGTNGIQVFRRGTTETARITSSGNVLIGTTTDNGTKFQVSGNIDAIQPSGTTSQIRVFQTGVTAWSLRNFATTGSFDIFDGNDSVVFISGSQTYNLGIRQTTFGTSATRTLAISTGVAPTTSPADAIQMYSADVVAGNAAPHFRTENGAVVKVYQETTGVGAATLVGGGGTTITDTDTFDGYTLKQIVKALRNQGLLA